MFKKFGQDLPQSLIDAVSGVLTEDKYDPAKPDAEAIARRKRLQALKDKQEDERDELSSDKPKGPRQVAGTAYGGSKQKDEPEDDEGESKPAAAQPAKPGRGRPKKVREDQEYDDEEYLDEGDRGDVRRKLVRSLNRINKGLGKLRKATDKPNNSKYSPGEEKEAARKAVSKMRDSGVQDMKKHFRKEEVEELEEKAVSTAQQKFMGMVYATKKGEKAASPAVAKAASGMSKKSARDFAKTKHAGLPTHKEEVELDEATVLSRAGDWELHTQGGEHKIKNTKLGKSYSAPKNIADGQARRKHMIDAFKKITDTVKAKTVEEVDLEGFNLFEEKEPPFTPDPVKKKDVIPGKSGEGYSKARHLARQGMKKYLNQPKNETVMGKAGCTSEENDLEESRGHKIIANKLKQIDLMSTGIAPDHHVNVQSVKDKLKDSESINKAEILKQKDTSTPDVKDDNIHSKQHKLNKQFHGYGKAQHEEVEPLEEISRDLASRYINKAKRDDSGKDRSSGIGTALKKKWGDKNYGMAEPKVKATSEEVELDETAALDQYIKSMGYDPKHMDKNKKVMFSKTNAFKTWASTKQESASSKSPGQEDDVHMSPGATARE